MMVATLILAAHLVFFYAWAGVAVADWLQPTNAGEFAAFVVFWPFALIGTLIVWILTGETPQ